MFPFWELVIAPALDAIGAKRVVEIGALRGETTVLVLEHLGPDAELHVIDPAPAFDPSEHEERFAGRYTLHRDISHNVLPHLPAMDAALIDGDHNWYTVYNELKMLAATARGAGAPLPLLLMHDVCWPYGRRDLYYAPERIPEEFRKKHAQRGVKPDKPGLVLAGGGLNNKMHNAAREGGPRNGVMTALDDFIAEHDQPLRRVVLPVYFGLALVVDEARLDRTPELAELFDRLEVDGAGRELLELAEATRLQAMVYQHTTESQHEQRTARSTRRYLDLLKASLLDEQYVENELRIEYLVRCAERGTPADAAILRDPGRGQHEARRRLETGQRAGTATGPHDTRGYAYTTMGRVRLDHLERSLETIVAEAVDGDLVECGTGRGGGAIFLRGFLAAHEIEDRDVWVVDTFRVSDHPQSADLNIVRDGFARFDLLDEHVHFVQGAPGQALADAPIQEVALLRLGTGAETAIGDVLDALYDDVAVGGFVVVDEFEREPVRRAVEEFRDRRHIIDPVERIDWSGACWQKTATSRPVVASRPSARLDRAPFPPAPSTARKDLTIVVVFYNMRREAERTLHSLSRAYQRGVDDLDYEVVAVENGSDDAQKLGEDLVRAFGPEFRYLDLGAGAEPSPARALNRGTAMGTGDSFAFMIDGAHVLTPGVLRFGMSGLAAYAPAIVATQQWYVGPGQQGDVVRMGYDQDFEDRLFREIQWPIDGYRLFDIGHFIGDRDWFDGVRESNCLFVPRRLLEQVGGFDESFSVPGGGYANLDFYERLGSSPDVTVATIIGEGSFHQVHGGTTTNVVDTDERQRRIDGFAEQYDQLRGRPFRGPIRTTHFVGSMPPRAARTKARRRIAPNVFAAGASDPDGLPTEAQPIPDELRTAFVDAIWRSLAWQTTTWLGRSVPQPPNDLFAYQEIIARTRPDWIVETGSGTGGRALFLASVCELLGHGRVLSIEGSADCERAEHPRITYLTGDPRHARTAREVRELVGSSAQTLVILGSQGNRQQMLAEFRHYSPLVPLGSYVVMEDTILNGHPVWPTFGAGPSEAVVHLTNAQSDFVPDPELERWGMTFNPHGFLKRVR
jgi:cephalosporin hydroxylase